MKIQPKLYPKRLPGICTLGLIWVQQFILSPQLFAQDSFKSFLNSEVAQHYRIHFFLILSIFGFIFAFAWYQNATGSKIIAAVKGKLEQIKYDRSGYFLFHHYLNEYKYKNLLLQINTAGIVTYVSPTSKNILGISPKKLHKHFSQLYPEIPQNKIVYKQLTDALEQKDTEILKWVMIDKNKKSILLKGNVTHQVKKNGKFTGIHVLLKDVTQLRYNEQDMLFYGDNLEKVFKARNSELRKLSAVVNQTFSPIVITDYNGIIEFVNSAYIKVSGYNEYELVGKKISEFRTGYHTNEYFKHLWSTLYSGESWSGELCRQKKDGTIYWVNAVITPVQDEYGRVTHFVSVNEDISERRKIHSELVRAKEKAEAANIAKSTFLANMSHEIRTPMNAILGFSEVLEHRITEPDLQEYLQTIRKSGTTLMALINDILDLSKIEAGKIDLNPEWVSVNALAEDIKLLFRTRAIKKSIEFEVNISPNAPAFIEFDELRLKQVITNITDNAIKFTQQGSVKVFFNFATLTEERLEFYIEVSDTGIGIPDNMQSEIFNDFTQSDGSITRSYGGTGLGLSITKKIVELNNGHISLNSQPGRGSTFNITFKNLKYLQSENVEAPKTTLVDQIHFHPAQILIIDDIESNSKLLKTQLATLGFTVDIANDGKEGFEKATQRVPDLIIMDIRMPIMDGYEATQLLSQHDKTKNIPIISCTASAFKEDEDQAENFGFAGFITKPFSQNNIIHELAKHLPHIVKETESPSNASNGLHLSDENITLMIQHLQDFWEQNKHDKSSRLKKELAMQLIKIGKTHTTPPISEVGEELLESIKKFKIHRTNEIWNHITTHFE